jgi:urease accessory protein
VSAKVSGGVRVLFVRDRARPGGKSRLASLYQHEPMRVLFPDPLDDPMPAAVLINTAGGLVGGDAVSVRAGVGPRAAARLTTQAAERVYRSAGATTAVDTKLVVARDGWLEWLPNETILFDAARLSRRLAITLAPGARCLAAELTVFGRRARGERFARGLLHDRWEIRRRDRLLWTDALRLEGDVAATIDHPACFDGAGAHAVVVCAGAGAAASLPALRAALPDDGPLAASLVGDIVVMRGLAREPHVLRRALAHAVAAARAAFGGWPARVPPTWTF